MVGRARKSLYGESNPEVRDAVVFVQPAIPGLAVPVDGLVAPKGRPVLEDAAVEIDEISTYERVIGQHAPGQGLPAVAVASVGADSNDSIGDLPADFVDQEAVDRTERIPGPAVHGAGVDAVCRDHALKLTDRKHCPGCHVLDGCQLHECLPFSSIVAALPAIPGWLPPLHGTFMREGCSADPAPILVVRFGELVRIAAPRPARTALRA